MRNLGLFLVLLLQVVSIQTTDAAPSALARGYHAIRYGLATRSFNRNRDVDQKVSPSEYAAFVRTGVLPEHRTPEGALHSKLSRLDASIRTLRSAGEHLSRVAGHLDPARVELLNRQILSFTATASELFRAQIFAMHHELDRRPLGARSAALLDAFQWYAQKSIRLSRGYTDDAPAFKELDARIRQEIIPAVAAIGAASTVP